MAHSLLTEYSALAIFRDVKVRFFITAAGATPVLDYIDSLDARDAAPVLAAVRDLEVNGLAGVGVVMRQLDGKLWELKVSQQRVRYVVLAGPEMVLLHAYKKQSQ